MSVKVLCESTFMIQYCSPCHFYFLYRSVTKTTKNNFPTVGCSEIQAISLFYCLYHIVMGYAVFCEMQY